MIIHTADPKSFLGYVCSKVAAMEPGQYLTVGGFELHKNIPSLEHNGAIFTAPDRVIGNIIGGAYTHSYHTDPMTGDVTFVRHKNTGERRYTDPDRRNPTPLA